MELAAARPVIVPDTIVIDGGKVFVSDTFTRACDRLGVSIQRARPRTPTDKAIVEATFGSINTLFCQHVAAYTGSNTTLRGLDATGAWTLPELQDLLDEWLLAGWQPRPHDALRDPLLPRRALSPNEMYAALVAAAGYLPLTLTGEDYLELLPVEWRQINAYGIRIDYRTYDCPELGPWRLQHSGITARRGLWEVHYDPYDATQVFVRTPDGWVTVPWTHLPMVAAPFAEFTWRHARRSGRRAGPRRHQRDRGRPGARRPAHPRPGRPGRQAQRPGRRPHPRRRGRAPPAATRGHTPSNASREPGKPADGDEDGPLATVIPFGVFDADAEAGAVVSTSPSVTRCRGDVGDEPLTTKEGWRRFVDHQPHRRCCSTRRRWRGCRRASGPTTTRPAASYHADLPLVNTPMIRKVISTSRLLIQLNRNQVSARRGVIISGASGTGKTTALTQLGRTHERHTRKRYPADRHRLPVLYVTVPPAATARMLAVEFARFLGLEFTGRANITDIVDAVCATAAHTRVELVCVDELHNLNLATRAGAEVSDQLKYFAERLPATFVYAGIDVEAQGLFAGVRGRQIAGRFTVIPRRALRLRHRRPTRAVAGADRHPGVRCCACTATAPAAWSRWTNTSTAAAAA